MKRCISFIFILCISGLGLAQVSLAATPVQGTNPPVADLKQMITTSAIKHGIPPEILKAMAVVESNYKQFNADGSPFVSTDGGIGVMQVTPSKTDMTGIDVNRLKTDPAYNIDVAASILENKWNLNYLPKINTHDKSNLEDWYFAIMAYNGASKVNDPSLNPGNTYQEKVYQRIASSSFVQWKDATGYFKFPKFDIRYNEGSNKMVFPSGVDYVTDKQTPSQQMYESKTLTFIDPRDGSVSLHSGSIGGAVDTKLWPYTPLTIESGPIESPDPDNDFVYYKVKGVTADGYVSSAYLDKGNPDMVFTDPGDDQRAAALAFMAYKGYARGYTDGSFHSNAPIKREHVAVMLDNILQMTMPSGYQLKADDVSQDNPYLTQLKKVEYNGYLGGGGKMRPNEDFTRSQMAQVMTKAFAGYYTTPTTTHQFKDEAAIWNPDAVNTIYANQVTVADPFYPERSITRSQFAIFIYRTMVKI